jgi:hypothetical protein
MDAAHGYGYGLFLYHIKDTQRTPHDKTFFSNFSVAIPTTLSLSNTCVKLDKLENQAWVVPRRTHDLSQIGNPTGITETL